MIGGHVLVIGVELLERPSCASEIRLELGRSREWQVAQQWIKLGTPLIPKFVLINRLLRDLDVSPFDYIIITDDDIQLPEQFLDTFLKIVDTCGFALAQPARTHDSEIHHLIVERVDGLIARQTRFVEIGPLFVMRRDIVTTLTPFDERSPMGWGYDYVWPVLLGARKMGIVDITPVRHVMRPALSGYQGAGDQMIAYLREVPHLQLSEAYETVTRYTP